MPFKDHYKTLGIASNATTQEIKKAYRALAHQYHPDKNPDNVYAQSYFRSVHEAYSVLANEQKRKLYDEERYFAGLSSRKEPLHINSTWILRQARKLRHHMDQVDSYRMNHRALHDYVLLLLSDDHIAVLQAERDPQAMMHLVPEVLQSVKRIRYELLPSILRRLTIVAGEDEQLQNLIQRMRKQRKVQAVLDRYNFLIILLITLAICVLMYVYGRRLL